MLKIKRFLLSGFILRLFLALIIFNVISIVSELKTVYSLPLADNPVIIKQEMNKAESNNGEVIVPSVESVKVEVSQVELKTVEKNSDSSVCRGVSESWKLVANPIETGLYTICNTAANDAMATVEQLNTAQNTYRRSLGLNTLSINNDLCKVALRRAHEVAVNFSHDGFEEAIDEGGISKNSFGENIASGPMSAVKFVEWSWDKSVGHRENMRSDWTDGCAGVYDRFAVFLFAK